MRYCHDHDQYWPERGNEYCTACDSKWDAVDEAERAKDWHERVRIYFAALKQQHEDRQLRSLKRKREAYDGVELAALEKLEPGGKRRWWGWDKMAWEDEFDKDDKDLSCYIGVGGGEDSPASDYKRSDLTYDEHCLQLIGRQFHGFMQLPREIRDSIYELLLVRGKVFVRNELQLPELSTKFYQNRLLIEDNYYDFTGNRISRYQEMCDQQATNIHRATEMSLIRGVSKTIQHEAERVFWGAGNQFVFPAGYWIHPLAFSEAPSRLYDDDDEYNPPPAKDLSYAFDMRDSPTNGPINDREDALEVWQCEEDEMSPLEFRERIHSMRMDQQMELWESRCLVMTRKLALQRLELDFHQCYCPVGCCRRAEDVCRLLALPKWRLKFPLRIEIIGHRGSEMQKLKDILAGSDDDASSRIHFSHERPQHFPIMTDAD